MPIDLDELQRLKVPVTKKSREFQAVVEEMQYQLMTRICEDGTQRMIVDEMTKAEQEGRELSFPELLAKYVEQRNLVDQSPKVKR